MFWMGTSPRILIHDPALVKKVLTNSNGDFERPEMGMPLSYIVTGLSGLNGEKWARHRKIVSAAFHAEKLKVLQKLPDNLKLLQSQSSSSSLSSSLLFFSCLYYHHPNHFFLVYHLLKSLVGCTRECNRHFPFAAWSF